MEKLGDKETYLGEIIKRGIGVCRHKAFLFKLLMETQNISVGCQTGFYMNENKIPISDSIGGHMWNFDEKHNIIDCSHYLPLQSNYLDNNYDFLYVKNSNLTPREQLKWDIRNLQPGEKLWIGLDENGALTSHIRNPEANFTLLLHWNENNEFILHKLTDEDIELDTENFLSGKAKINKKELIRYKECLITIDPAFIRANFFRKIKKATLTVDRIAKFIPSDGNYNPLDLAKASGELILEALQIFESPNFQKSWGNMLKEVPK